MNWTTLYIKGREDFQVDVRKKLEGSKLGIMPGYLANGSDGGAFDLYWVDEAIPLREIKEAIGSKLIWKYRLHFFRDLEAFIASESRNSAADFTQEERSILDAMRKSA